MSDIKKIKYELCFNALNPNEPNYIDNFIILLNKILMERNHFVKNFGEDNKRIEFFNILKKELINLGVHNKQIKFFDCGHSSLVFKLNDKVIKIGKVNNNYSGYKKGFSCTIPLFLDICYKIGEMEYYTIQISPYVDTRNISYENLYDVYCILRKLGYIWNDPTIENVGRIIEDFDFEGKHYSKGDLVIIDLEDIAYVGDETPDVVLDEISCMSYNKNVYRFEKQYMDEYKNSNRKII